VCKEERRKNYSSRGKRRRPIYRKLNSMPAWDEYIQIRIRVQNISFHYGNDIPKIDGK
jgi:hypothetical protein